MTVGLPGQAEGLGSTVLVVRHPSRCLSRGRSTPRAEPQKERWGNPGMKDLPLSLWHSLCARCLGQSWRTGLSDSTPMKSLPWEKGPR